ncbi:MAG: GDP-mannose 4,6-dehydratase [Candidatus Dormibacteraeota bacterium]|jgi:GDPmannose 4,6-dehydratase|nr:GDP-mannose 4,6-dehydratase [Candidatus Dormibacteraeota bacterium]
MSKTALITGVTGQDGSYLAELLLSRGYDVHGVVRRTSSLNRSRIEHLHVPRDEMGGRAPLTLHYGDLTDSGNLNRLIKSIRPDEVYNLAAQSHVHISFDQPEYTGEVDGLGATRLLEAIRTSGIDARFYQASTSEMFGSSPPPQNELSPFHPRSPYAAAKVYAHWITINYREAHQMFACSGILFNHESPRRGENFVTRKVTRGVAAALASGAKLRLGNLDARRDWGHARDYVEAMWLMLQQPTPEDYVIGTGKSRSVRDLLDVAFGMVGLDWHEYVETDATYTRPAEVPDLVADPTKARERLHWTSTRSFESMIREMLEADLRAAGLNPDSNLRTLAEITSGPAAQPR